MNWTSPAGLIEPLLQGLPRTMEANPNISFSSLEILGNIFAGFTNQIRAPDNLRIFRLQRGKEFVEAIANYEIEPVATLCVYAQCLKILVVGLRPTLFSLSAIIVNKRRLQNAAHPWSQLLGVSDIINPGQNLDIKVLQNVPRFFSVAESARQKSKEILMDFRQNNVNCIALRSTFAIV